MAKVKKKDPKDKLKGLNGVKKLWKAVPPRQWLAILQEIAPHSKWELAGANTIKGCCPYHDEKGPSFVLSLGRSFGKCFGGTCGKFVTDMVQLVAKLKVVSYTEALMWLRTRITDMDKLIGTDTAELNEYHLMQELKKETAMAMKSLLTDVIRERPEHLKYCEAVVTYLVRGRGIPIESIPGLPLGVFGKPEHIKSKFRGTRPELMERYDTYFEGVNKDKVIVGALCFHYNDSPGTISRFKIRYLEQDALDKCAQYANPMLEMPQSEARLLVSKKFNYLPDPFTNEIGIFGLHRYQHMVGNSDANAYVTEGEFDAIAVMIGQDQACRTDFMQLAIGGTAGADMSFLREYGVRNIWLVPDHPSKAGDSWVCGILGTKENFTFDASTKPLALKVFVWPPQMMGVDLDDAILRVGYDRMVNFLLRERNIYFTNSIPWVTQKCDAEVAAIKALGMSGIAALELDTESGKIQAANIKDDMTRGIKESILNWFKFVHDPTERMAFAQGYSLSEGIDISLLENVSASIHSLDTMEGVTARVINALEEHFAIAFYTPKEGSVPALYMWSKKRHENVLVPQTDKQIAQIISMYTGKGYIPWLDSILGGSEVYTSGIGRDALNDHKTKLSNGGVIMESVFHNMIGAAQDKDELIPLGQGIHHHTLPADMKRDGYIYFLNGKLVWRGKEQASGMEWEEMNNSVDAGILFNLDKRKKWSFVSDTADLYAATQVNNRKVFEDVRLILNGWKFQHHETMVDYMAAYIISLPIMPAIGDVNITYLTGEPESGKTSFASGIMGGDGSSHDVPSLLESVCAMTDTTAAGMYQKMDGVSLTFSLDEAEGKSKNGKGAKADRMQAIYDMLNSLPMGGAKIDRGSAQGAAQAVSYHLRMPVFMAAINLPSDTTFMSRVMVLYTEKDPGHESLEFYINSKFTPDQLQQLKQDITIGLLPHIHELIALRGTLARELRAASHGIAAVSGRFIQSLLTPLVVYKFLGNDPIPIYQEILRKNKTRLESINTSDHMNELVNACLYTNAVKTMVEDIAVFVNPRKLIMDNTFNILNNAACGVYYLEDKEWIIIVWRQAKHSVLNQSHFKLYEEGSLRELVSSNPYTVLEVTPSEHAHIQHQLQLTDVKNASGYSVIEAEYLFPQGTGAPADTPIREPAPKASSAEASMVIPEEEAPMPEAPPAGRKFVL